MADGGKRDGRRPARDPVRALEGLLVGKGGGTVEDFVGERSLEDLASFGAKDGESKRKSKCKKGSGK